MITTPDVFIYIILQFLIYFPAGFIILRNRMKAYPFLISLPIFICTGLFVELIILSIIGIFYVGDLVLVSTSIIFYIVIFRIYKNYFSLTCLKVTLKQSFRKIRAVHIVTLSIFIVTISGFSLLAGFMEWPRGHDALLHGYLTSILVHNHKLQTTLAPFAPTQSWLEPFGLHLMSGNLSMLVGIFPGESLLVFATTLLILFVLLTYSLVYVLTKSLAFSVLASTAVFYFYPALNLEYSLIGLYYLGAHAALFGDLGLVLFLTYVSVFKDSLQSKKLYSIIAISLIGLLVVYPPFIIIPLIYLIIMEIKSIVRGTKHLLQFIRGFFIRKSHEVIVSLIVLIIPFTLQIPNIFVPSSSEISRLIELGERLALFSEWYQFPFERFAADIPTICIVLVTIILAIDSLLKKKRVALSIFYLLYTGIELLSIREGSTSDLFWIFSP